ncbi:MAG: 5-deoxy-glucuronate isomerase [Bauldia sp.]|nr:5-deoxy-glucuronate isomerase [Bauldia sp.]
MQQSSLLVRPDRNAAGGRIIHVTPESAGWTYVGFDVYRLAAGRATSDEMRGREACLVFRSGKAAVEVGGRMLGTVGERASPFDGKPWAVYVPAGSNWRVSAATEVEFGVCSAPASGKRAARVISPDDLAVEQRGRGTNLRHVTNILPETDPTAENLLVVEVITPGGHWSSYPPHKHDRDALPEESLLEETYYHRLKPKQGFAIQRIYTDDRSLDETIAVADGDVTLVARGYHPCAAPHGYDLYYLNTMAGPRRTWRFHNDPAHEWILKQPA